MIHFIMPYILDFFKVLEKNPQKVHTPKSDFFAITKSLKNYGLQKWYIWLATLIFLQLEKHVERHFSAGQETLVDWWVDTTSWGAGIVGCSGYPLLIGFIVCGGDRSQFLIAGGLLSATNITDSF